MSMNDEQFQEDTEALRRGGYVSLVDDLRARDTAQREALARVEAELKREKAEAWELCGIVDARTDERDTAQAQLAEAMGLLKHVKDWFGWGDLPESLSKLDAFLARHAQACEVTGNSRGPAHAEQQEAHGAQAGDERAAFEAAVTEDALASGCNEPEFPRTEIDGCEVYKNSWTRSAWWGWNARAALATQPAARGAEQ